MKCSASINVDCNKEEAEHIKKLFAVGDKEISGGRAMFEVLKDEKGITFTVKANDAVALRAMITNITRTLKKKKKSKTIQ